MGASPAADEPIMGVETPAPLAREPIPTRWEVFGADTTMAPRQIIVDIADMRVARGPDVTLATYALGSCVGVAVFDPVVHVGGLLHFMLPDSKINPGRAKANPFMFADTGVPRLFLEAYELGAEKKRMVVKVVGGANVLDGEDYFNIGKRNYMALRKILHRNGVQIAAQDIGGHGGKTMKLDLGTGHVLIRTPEGGERTL